MTQLSASGAYPRALTLLENGGGCFSEFDGVAIDLRMNIPRFDAGSFNYTTFVDGRMWAPQIDLCALVRPGESWIGRGVDRVVGVCDSTFIEQQYRLLPGPHTVSMEARLPGTDIVFTTETITIDLTCPEPTSPEVCTPDSTQTADATGSTSDTGGGCQSTAGSTTLMPLLALFGLFGGRRRNPSRKRDHNVPS